MKLPEGYKLGHLSCFFCDASFPCDDNSDGCRANYLIDIDGCQKICHLIEAEGYADFEEEGNQYICKKDINSYKKGYRAFSYIDSKGIEHIPDAKADVPHITSQEIIAEFFKDRRPL